MTQQFIDWADKYFKNPNNLNKAIPKKLMYHADITDAETAKHGMGFITQYPEQARYVNTMRFKQLIRQYCSLREYSYNISRFGRDIKRGGVEFIEVGAPLTKKEIDASKPMNRIGISPSHCDILAKALQVFGVVKTSDSYGLHGQPTELYVISDRSIRGPQFHDLYKLYTDLPYSLEIRPVLRQQFRISFVSS